MALELREDLYSWWDANCFTSFNCLLPETGMVQLHSGHEQGNGSEEGLSQTWNLCSMSSLFQCKLTSLD